jgi:polyprenyl-phospho-N-acetylgalactosaminyl synthase
MAHASELLTHVARRGLRYCEVPVVVTYTDYSRSKGQSSLNAVNIMFDLAVHRMYARS